MASTFVKLTKGSGVRDGNAPSDLTAAAVAEISDLLRKLLADVFTLYLKTKNLDEDATQMFAMTDAIAERARKIGGKALRSIDEVVRLRRLKDNDEDSAPPEAMLRELASDNRALTTCLREVHCSDRANPRA